MVAIGQLLGVLHTYSRTGPDPLAPLNHKLGALTSGVDRFLGVELVSGLPDSSWIGDGEFVERLSPSTTLGLPRAVPVARSVPVSPVVCGASRARLSSYDDGPPTR